VNYTDEAFLVLFGVTFALYYAARGARQQVWILVIASLIFYAWESPPLLAVFCCSWLLTGALSYLAARAPSEKRARTLTGVGVVSNLALLAFFKYKFLFLAQATDAEQIRTVADWLIFAPLPIGISFYVFHAISLLVDSFRGDSTISGRSKRVYGHLADTLLYLVFFPQLIAGPIIKAKQFFPQVTYKAFSEVPFRSAFGILTVGFFFKRVVADNLSEQTYWIAFPYFLGRSSIDLLFLLVGYSAQIFADFAGYSLIAIGLAKLLGYTLPRNFDFPYLASSFSEFWRKWHISLSSWLRDYLYIPLGGNKTPGMRTYLNLMVVMFLGGLWHGAAWSFAIWGVWHGLALMAERPFATTRFMTAGGVCRVVRVLIVFSVVTVGWLFFKLQDAREAFMFLRSIFTTDVAGVSPSNVLIAIYVLPVFGYHLFSLYRERLNMPGREYVLAAMLFLTIANSGPVASFIYFQF